MPLISKICLNCGITFSIPHWREPRKYCSRSCYREHAFGEHSPHWQGGETKKICQYCGKKFTVEKNRENEVKFCSQSCNTSSRSGEEANHWQGGEVERTCQECGKVFFIKRSLLSISRGKFCSQTCNNRGQNSGSWNGGSSFEPYPPTFNKAFKKSIRKRDNHRCFICGKPGKVVHHINYSKDDTTQENCITLCVKCHGKTNHNRNHWIEYFHNHLSVSP